MKNKIAHLEKQLNSLDKNREIYGKDYLTLRNYYISRIREYEITRKIPPDKKKIYNNTYRLKKKDYRVDTESKTIYCVSEKEAIKITQVKNLMNSGFVLQLEIN